MSRPNLQNQRRDTILPLQPDSDGMLPFVAPLGCTGADWSNYLTKHGAATGNLRFDSRRVVGWLGALVHWVNDAKSFPDMAAERLKVVKRTIRLAKRDPDLAGALGTAWAAGGLLAVISFVQALPKERRPS